MKLGVISDLHIDSNHKASKRENDFSISLANQLNKQNIETLLLAGDISSDYRISQDFIEQVKQQTDCNILFVPGNHDFWSRKNKEENTEEIYRYFRRQDESILEKPFLLNDEWAVVGNAGWYDYGYADHNHYTKEEFDKMKYKAGAWNDKYYVHWAAENQVIAQTMLERIESDLQQIGSRKVILMTHIVTHPEFVVPLPNKIYDYFNAFLGSRSYETLYKNYPIAYSIMGHVHFRKTYFENDTQYICACLGSKRYWANKNDVEAEIKRTLVTFDV